MQIIKGVVGEKKLSQNLLCVDRIKGGGGDGDGCAEKEA